MDTTSNTFEEITVNPVVTEAEKSALILAEVFRAHIDARTTPVFIDTEHELTVAHKRHVTALGPLALYFLDDEKPHVRDKEQVMSAVSGIRAIHEKAFKELFIEVIGTDDQNFDDETITQEESARMAFLNYTATGQRRRTSAKRIKKATAQMLRNDMQLLSEAKKEQKTVTADTPAQPPKEYQSFIAHRARRAGRGILISTLVAGGMAVILGNPTNGA